LSKERVLAELEEIRAAGGGLLMPSKVVEYAENPETALHGEFNWDDTEAARLYRLQQAREVIRVHVTIVGENPQPIRAYVSLSTDRTMGGGYRAIVDVLDSSEQRAVMLMDALNELRAFKRKYDHLVALKPLWEAMNDVSQRVA
jgi:hypothetical protein